MFRLFCKQDFLPRGESATGSTLSRRCEHRVKGRVTGPFSSFVCAASTKARGTSGRGTLALRLPARRPVRREAFSERRPTGPPDASTASHRRRKRTSPVPRATPPRLMLRPGRSISKECSVDTGEAGISERYDAPEPRAEDTAATSNQITAMRTAGLAPETCSLPRQLRTEGAEEACWTDNASILRY